MHKLVTALLTSSVLALLTTTATVAQTSNPTLKIISPSEGQTIYGNRVSILLSAENFEIVDFQTNPTVKSGQGHIHVWLDDNNPTRESAKKLIKEEDTFTDVPYGDHVLRAELVNNNHSSLNPRQVITVNFKSTALPTPSPQAASGFDKNTALVILVVVSLVIVAAWWYTKEEDEMPAKSISPTRKSTTKKSAKRRRK